MSSDNEPIFSNKKAMLSARKAAKLLQCAPDYVSRLCREGRLDGMRHQGQWYIDPASLKRFEAEREAARSARAETLAAERRHESQAYAHANKSALGKAAGRIHARIPALALPKYAAVALLVSALLGGSTLASSTIMSGADTAQTQMSAAAARINSPFFSTGIFSLGSILNKVEALFAPSHEVAVMPATNAGGKPPQAPSSPAISATQVSFASTTQTFNTFTYPVTERTIERVVAADSDLSKYVTYDFLSAQVESIYRSMSHHSGGGIADFSGLTTGDIPPLNYLPLTGGTLTGALTLPYASTTATSTFAGLALKNLDCSIYNNNGKLTTDASGNIVCDNDNSSSGSGAPGGNNTYVQFNDSGSFGGDAGFTYNKTADRLTVAYASSTGITADYASTTNLVVSGISNSLLKTVNGVVTAALAGLDYQAAGNYAIFAYPFLGNATTTSIAFNGGLSAATAAITYASTTAISGTTAQFTSASSTNLVISGITSGSTQCLQINSSGTVSGTGSACGSGSGSITAIGPAGQTQNGTSITFATSTTGSDFTITAAADTISFNLPIASALNTGKLTATDWNVFNNKISSTSLSAGAGIAYNSATGVITNTIGYPFPSNATTTQITFSGGLVGNLTGNASTATALQTGRLINGIVFDGTANITVAAASSTLLADTNTFSGTNIFSNTIVGSITGNAGTVTNGVYTTTFNSLFDPRFVTNLAATTSIASITTLPNLSLAYSQLTGVPAVGAYPFALAGNATSTLTQFNGGLTAFASSTIGSGAQAGGLTISGGATTTGSLQVNGGITINGNLKLAGITGSVECLHVGSNGVVSGTGSDCGTGGGGSGTFLGLSDVPGSYIANQIYYTNASADAVTASNSFTFDGTTLTAPAVTVNTLTITGSSSFGTIVSGIWHGTPVADSFVADNLTISGGTINNTPIGASTPSTAVFTNATTTNLAAYNGAKFGATATSSFASDGALTLSQALTVANGGTGSTTLGGLLSGNGTGALTSAAVLGPLAFSANTLSITQSSLATDGYLSSADFASFNGKISSSSLSAAYPLSYNSSTGAFTTNFSTTTTNIFSGTNTFNGGVVANILTVGTSASIASTTLTGNTLLTNATTTNLAITGIPSALLKTSADGTIVAAVAGTDYLTSLTGAASSTLLADNNTFSGNNMFSNTITGSISGNAGTVTNGVYTTTFNGLFDNRLSASSSISGITTLPNLSLPYSQLTGTPAIAGYPFPSNATSTSIAFNGGLTGVLTGSVVGNASTATALQTGRTINGITFDGTANITITAASSTLLANNNTFSGANTFSSLITGSISGNAGTVTTNANLTGAVTSVGNTTSLGSFSSANLISALTDETGSGSAVFGTNATLSSTTLAGNTLLSNATTTNLGITGILGALLKTMADGSVVAAVAGTDYLTSANTFAYPFPSNATTTLLAFNGGATFAGATTTALAVTGSSTISNVLNVGGALNAASTVTAASFSGAGTGLTGTAVGLSIGGNAGTATALQAPRTINGVTFDGTANITVTAASSTLLAGNNTFSGANSFTGNTTLAQATSSSFAITGIASSLLKATASGSLVAAIAGTDYLTAASIFAYPFPSNATTTSIAFNGGLTATTLVGTVSASFASTTLTGSTLLGSATTTSLGLAGITSSILKTNAQGTVVAADAGTDYEVPLTFSTGLNRAGNVITNTGVTSATGTPGQINVDANTGSITFSLPTLVSLTNLTVSSATTTNLFSSRLAANTAAFGSTATTTIDAAGNLAIAGTLSGAGLSACSGSADKLLWNAGVFSCGVDAGSSGGTGDVSWTFFNNSAIRVSTTTNQVLIGASATTSLARLQVVGGIFTDNATSTSSLFGGVVLGNVARFGSTATTTIDAAGNVGVGTSSPAAHLAVAGGNILQVATGAPVLAGSVSIGSHTYATAVMGRYAYVADLAGGLRIMDISNPASPSVVGSLAYNGGSTAAVSVAVAGKYAYVGDTTAGLVIIDVSNPASPAVVSSSNILGAPWNMALSGKYLYVADGDDQALKVVDVSNAAGPAVVGIFAAGGAFQPYSVAVSGKYAYVGDIGGSKIYIVDISNPAAPAKTATYSAAGIAPVGLYPSSRYLYVADADKGFYSLDVSNPNTAPTLVGSYNPTGSYYGIAVAGRYAYIADNGGAMTVVDINNQAAPALVGSYATGANPLSITVVGKYAYVSADTGGLIVVDINGASLPAANIASLQSDTANIADTLTVGGNIYAGGGLDVGISGIFSRGTIAAYVASSTQANPAVATFMGGNVGIGTTSPFAALSVNGSGFFDGNVVATNIIATGTLSVAGNTTLASATSTNFAISNITSSLLKTTASGSVVAAVAGADYLTAATTFAYPFPSNATSTNIAFNGGLTAVGATTTALAVTGSTTVSGQFNATGGATLGNATIGTLTLTNALTVPNGGTGATSLTGILKGNGTGAFTAVTGTNNFLPKWSSNSLTSTSLLFDTGSEVRLGTTTNYVGNSSRLFVWGGTSGANIDVMGDPSVSGGDQATVEVESSSYPTTFKSMYIQYVNHGVGTSMGFANTELARLVFGGDTNLIYTNSAQPLIFGTNGAERLRLGATGNVGIGTTSPFAMLSVNGSGYFGGNLTATNLTATGTLTALNILATGSTTLQNFTALNATTSQATTTSLAITGVTSSLLKALSNGAVVAAVAGTDYLTAATTFSYPFPSNATSTQLAFNGGATFAGATTTALAVTGSTTISSVLNVGGALNANGGIIGNLTGNASTATALQTSRTINGVAFNGSADITVTAAAGTLTGTTLNSGVTASSLISVGTLTALTVSGNTSLTNASTTNLSANTVAFGGTGTTSVSSNGTLTTPALTIASLSGLLKATSGVVSAATAGIDYATPANVASAYPFQLSGNATSTLTQFNGGLTAFASSTIGAGGQVTGLTISGGATTTGNARVFGSFTVGPGTGSLVGTNEQLVNNQNGAAGIAVHNSTSGNETALFAGAGGDGSVGSISNNDFKILTNNTEVARFTATGRVGIGTTTPTNVLTVQRDQNASTRIDAANYNSGSNAQAGFGFINDTGSGGALLVNSSGNTAHYGGANSINLINLANAPLTFSTSNTVQVTVTGGGNVGVGTTTPFGKLSVSGAGTGQGVTFSVANVNDNPKFVVLDNGDIGIGTLTPELHEYTGTGGILTIQNTPGTLNQGVLELANRTDPTSSTDAQSIGDIAFSAASQTSAADLRSALIRASLLGATANNRGSILQFYTRADGGTNDIVERMRIDSSGNVGIGTTSPWGKLAVSTPAQQDGLIPLFNVASTTNASLFTVLGNGRVSIGTTTTSDTNGANALTVQGAAGTDILSFTDGIAKAGLFINNAAASQQIQFGSVTNHDLAFFTNNIARVNIASSGKVGIGTTTPFAQLSVNAAAGVNSFAIGSSTGTYFAVSPTGNVGIGTANPTQKLEISGSGAGGGATVRVGTTDSTISGNAAFDTLTDSTEFAFGNNVSARTTVHYGLTLGGWAEISAFNGAGGTNNGLVIGTNTAKPLVFGTNNAERMRIDGTSGNVGIGTTTPLQKLSVVGQGVFASAALTDDPGDVSGPALRVGYNTAGDYGYVSAISSGISSKSLVLNRGGGNVGVGNAAPQALLQVGAGTDAPNVSNSLYVSNNGATYVSFRDSLHDTEEILGADSSNVYIGSRSNTNISVQWGSNNVGNFNSGGVYTATSDRRLKTNIQTLDATSGLEAIEKLNPVTFTFINNPGLGPQLGFIAQDVQDVFPQLVNSIGTTTVHLADGTDQVVVDTKGLNYSGFVVPLVKAVQEIANLSGTFKATLAAWLGDAGNGLVNLFAETITAQVVNADTVNAKKLCLEDVCVTKAELQQLLNNSSAGGSGSVSMPPADEPPADGGTGSTTPPADGAGDTGASTGSDAGGAAPGDTGSSDSGGGDVPTP